MADNVAGVSSVTHLDREPQGGAIEAQKPVQDAQNDSDDAGRYRLTIERESTGYVYKTLDRVTGEVVRQFPREEVLKLRQSPAYDVGRIIKTEI
ncbi:flagellar protein FlaG [Brevundimonas diminuta]|uniref:flagellar protein FlaG n=1 Tax=Brevundimonas diminuta TaxID=293 RepID=UPI002097D8DA|nr:flagellar protein FlaG [Brevundimonas diminuta]MCO8017279.1 flagellar protein FlaG [Brevundimonas diminuta]MCO8020799.1 flagellar protein FlaG [Brevundimonas diminuta]